MIQNLRNGQSTLEYMALLAMIMAAFLLFQKYISRGITGQWRGVGDSFGQGRQYDPNLTTECLFDFRYTNSWYDQDCFEENCREDCYELQSLTGARTRCKACIQSCQTTTCDQ